MGTLLPDIHRPTRAHRQPKLVTGAVDEINATGLEPQLSMLAVHKGHARGQSSMSAVALERTRAVRTPRQAAALPNSGCPASSLHAHGGRGPGWGWEHTQGGSAWPSRAGGTCAPPRRCRRTAHVPRTEQAHHTHLFHHLNLDSSLILVTLALGLHASTSGPCKTQLRRAAPRQRRRRRRRAPEARQRQPVPNCLCTLPSCLCHAASYHTAASAESAAPMPKE